MDHEFLWLGAVGFATQIGGRLEKVFQQCVTFFCNSFQVGRDLRCHRGDGAASERGGVEEVESSILFLMKIQICISRLKAQNQEWIKDFKPEGAAEFGSMPSFR